jgi:hypothetical protein
MRDVVWLIISLLCGFSPLLAFGVGMVWMTRQQQ